MSDRGQHTPSSADPASADALPSASAEARSGPASATPGSASTVPGPAGATPGSASAVPGPAGATPGPASTVPGSTGSPRAHAVPADTRDDDGNAAAVVPYEQVRSTHALPAGATSTDLSPRNVPSTDVTLAESGPASPGGASSAVDHPGTGSRGNPRAISRHDPSAISQDSAASRAGSGPDAGPAGGSPDVAPSLNARSSLAAAEPADPGTHPARPGTGDVPFEINAAGDGDAPFRLTAPQSDDPDDEPARPGRTRTVLLASLLAVALAGAGTLAWFGWQVNSQRQTTLSTPVKVGALTLDDSEQATATADYLQTALSAEIELTKAVGAVYTGNDEKSVLFFGGTTLLWSPESDLDTAIRLVSDDQGSVTGLKEVDAGEFGGTMKCGTTKSTEGDLAVCGWADHGSLALAMFPNRTEAEAAPLMRELRSAIQIRD